MEQAPVLAIVIPCFNEAEVLPATSPAFRAKIEELVGLGMVSERSYVLFVDDGSSDATWDVIEGLAADGGVFRGIRLSRNRGHQNALLAGLMEVRGKCDISISIDCDGQDDINAMNDMVEAYCDGAEVVYGVRSSRKTDTAFKRGSAQAFYKLLSSMGAETVYNHADYRLLGSKVLDALSQFEEVNLFLRGMVPLVGFKSTSVYYERHERVAGESHYPPPAQDDRACGGRYHESFGKADPFDHDARHCGVDRQLHRRHLGNRHGFDGQFRCGLGEPGVRAVPIERRVASQHRRDRRVRGQDLPRNEAPPALHRVAACGFRRRVGRGRILTAFRVLAGQAVRRGEPSARCQHDVVGQV